MLFSGFRTKFKRGKITVSFTVDIEQKLEVWHNFCNSKLIYNNQ